MPANLMRRPAAARQKGASRKGFMKWSATLKTQVKNECARVQRTARDDAAIKALIVNGCLRCPLCPTKSFRVDARNSNHKREFQNHIQKQHVSKTFGTTSTKECRMIAAMARSSAIQRTTQNILEPGLPQASEPEYLQKVAATLREQLSTSPSWGTHQDGLTKVCGKMLDKQMVLLLDLQDTRHILRVDAACYHHLSAQYGCTDRFLWQFFGSLLHPFTKAAHCRVMNHIVEKCGWNGSLIPTDKNLYKSLCEALFSHPRVRSMMETCRQPLDMRLIKIDGQYSSFLSVLFQAKHGSRRSDMPNPYAPNLHVALSVLCGDGVLNVHPCSSEAVGNQIAAINEGIGETRKGSVLGVCSDNPPEIDKPETFREYTNLECIIKDPVHVALKPEQAFGEKTVDMTALIRRCVVKFKQGFDDGAPYFTRAVGAVGPSTLPAIKAAMSIPVANRRINAISNPSYPDQAYVIESAFVKDLAAIIIKYPGKASRIIPKSKKTTVYGSLVFATRPENLGYLFNHSRFIARHPDIKPFYGSSANEAFHLQFKGYFRNVFHQTGRNASLVCKAVTIAKLLIAKFLHDMPGSRMREHELLQKVVQNIVTSLLHLSQRLQYRCGRIQPLI
jgi:hypothetical protein